MSQGSVKSTGGSAAGATPPGAGAPAAGGSALPRWRDVWQVPLLALAGAGLIAGVVAAFKTAPAKNYDDAFAFSTTLMGEEKYGEAIEALNRDVRPILAKGKLSAEQRRRYHTMVARSLAMGQKMLHIDREENHRGVVEHFLEAERQNATLEPRDVGLLAESYLSLNRANEALERAETLPADSSDLKVELYRQMIGRAMSGANPDDVRALDLIGRMSSAPNVSADAQAWGAARQAEILLSNGQQEDALDRLLRTMPRLNGVEPGTMAELYTLLGRAYLDTGVFGEAERQLARAMELLGDSEPGMADAMLMQARIEFNRDKVKAEELYSQVAERFAGRPQSLPAQLGLAETRALLGRHEEALGEYAEVVGKLRNGEATREVGPTVVVKRLIANSEDRFNAADFEHALAYANLAEVLGGGVDGDPAVVTTLAKTREKLGEEALRANGVDPRSIALADPATQAVAREHFEKAGRYYRAYAQQVVVTDNDAYGQALWSAGDMFDRAGDLDAAIEAFQQYAEGFGSDPKAQEAKYRLGLTSLAKGAISSAEKLFRELMETRGSVQGSGVYGDAAAVALARTLLGDGDAANDAEAEELLRRATAGEFGGPATQNYRAALRELSDYLYRTHRYEEAVDVLREYVTRGSKNPEPGEEREIDRARFRWADSMRLSAREAGRMLAREQMPEADRRAKERQRTANLRDALAMFEKARDALEAKSRRSTLEETYLRNACFYMGECAFELGQHEAAIRNYADAKDRYPRDPASLVALVQIVASHKAMGDLEKARTAQRRARAFFESLPESSWDDPTLPMGREQWQRWLDASKDLETAEGGGVESEKRTAKGENQEKAQPSEGKAATAGGKEEGGH